MARIEIDLSDLLAGFVEEQAQANDMDIATYLEQLVRREWQRIGKAQLEAKLLEAMDSGEPIEVTEETWTELRRKLLSKGVREQSA